MTKKRCLLLIFFVLLFLPGCATFYNPATGQKEYIFVTTPTEVSLGKALANKISEDHKISKDKKTINRAKEIGAKIASISDRRDLKYRFSVIEDDTLNAFTSPGGYVYVNSGLMKKVTDDELACVIGHEIAHVAARHIAKKMQGQIGYDILMNIAMRKGGLREFQKAVSISYNLMSLGYSRKDELMADRLGVRYAYKAGYDPYAMISFLEKIKTAEKDSMGPVFLRSHPHTDQRIKMLSIQIPDLIKKSKNTKATVEKNTAPDSRKPVKKNTRVMCPKCRKIFKASVKYCPYDGTKLQ